ncbi:MAG: hypothetical protein KHZ54_16540 [Erysipelotrichaceae bacterium]|nr:hypothetical protein [Erysipelotrichaceae bacterium]
MFQILQVIEKEGASLHNRHTVYFLEIVEQESIDAWNALSIEKHNHREAFSIV